MKLVKTTHPSPPPQNAPQLRRRKSINKSLMILWMTGVTVMLVIVIFLLTHLLHVFQHLATGLGS